VDDETFVMGDETLFLPLEAPSGSDADISLLIHSSVNTPNRDSHYRTPCDLTLPHGLAKCPVCTLLFLSETRTWAILYRIACGNVFTDGEIPEKFSFFQCRAPS